MSLSSAARNEMNKMSETQERSGDMKNYDEAASTAKIEKVQAEVLAKKEAEAQKAAEIASFPVEEEEVQLIADALHLDEPEAKLRLQKKKGDVVAVLRETVGLPKQAKS